MNEVKKQIDLIEIKSKRLIDLLKHANGMLNKAQELNNDLKSKINLLQEKNLMLEDEIKSLKLAKFVSSVSVEEKEQLKADVDRYIHELDKCIGLLKK